MNFEELCAAVRLYVDGLPSEAAFRRDDWRGLLDDTLASIRAELANINDDAEAV